MVVFVLFFLSLVQSGFAKQDCVAGDWEEWSSCTTECGALGTRERSRAIAQLPTTDGGQCDKLQWDQKESCNRVCYHGGLLTDTHCDCADGYTGQCCEIDINECDSNNGGCQQLCVNRKGGFQCECFPGFEENGNGYCTDINECASSPCDKICVNVPGSYQCACNSNHGILFTDGKTCVATDYCVVAEGVTPPDGCSCGDSGSLVVFDNEMVCACPSGYFLDVTSRECKASNPCGAASFCIGGICHTSPLTGEALCDCGIGRGLGVDGMECMDVDQCQTGFSQCSHTCQTVNSGHVCLCPAGMILGDDHKTCQDENECIRDPIPCSHSCTNLHLSFYCSCPEAMELEADNRTCCEIGKCINPASHPRDHTTSLAVGVSVTTLIVVGILVFIIYRMVKKSLNTNEKVMRQMRTSDVYYNNSNTFELEQRAMSSGVGATPVTKADHYSTFQKRRPFSIEEDDYEDIKSTKEQ